MHTTQHAAQALKKKVEAELHNMTADGITDKTETVNAGEEMVVDSEELNQNMKREHFHLPTRNELSAEMARAKFFSKLGASAGFGSLPLDEKKVPSYPFSALLGKSCFLRLFFKYGQHGLHLTAQDPGCKEASQDSKKT